MRFDLNRLGNREFEHLTQSIAVAELGPGVGVFGSGADGGREATFDGPVPINTNGHHWNGYGIIQAKYKEFPTLPKDNATWLIEEINEEMKGWSKRKEAGRKIPKYYIVSTNVRLSPRDDGGIDRVDECLKGHARRVGFDGWLIWHCDTISTFLVNNRDIRISYSSWVTPGDVLAQVLSDQNDSASEIPEALKSFTAKELIRGRYVNLDQAGSADDRSVALAEIFIDLPYQPWSGIEEAGSKGSLKALSSIISAADESDALKEERGTVRGTNNSQRLVLVAGPGQGKTTLTQFACQMYRAALVTDTPAAKFGKVKVACEKIFGLMKQEGLPRPKNRRWPVNIQLTRLADSVARGEAQSVLGYLANTITEKTTIPISAHQLRSWLATYPWFVALDGLDEVPAASNRGEILSLIDDFLIDAASVSGDVFIVATTRPQGYTDEFSPQYYKHLQLTALSKEIAMSYGRKLAIARHGMDSDRTDQLIERLDRASDESATSRLMTTPLQVTILAVLLERVGQAPKDRYNLFADYYRVIYERELEKPSQASSLLRDHRSDVDAIHAQVGLVLQTRSENSGETHSTLSADELRQIVQGRLRAEGHKGESLLSLCDQIIQAATDRLVFLVSSRSDEIGFEIRSLQEFWAAQGIMQRPENRIPDTLRLIASSSHWRNTVLFALGHIFSRRENLRETVISLVAELNSHSVEHEEVKKATLAGSRLAVAILSDGMVRSPIYLQSLTDQAAELLQLPPDTDVRRVPHCIPADMTGVVARLAENRLYRSVKSDDSSLLYCLSVLACRDDLTDETRNTLESFIAPLYSALTENSKCQLMALAYATENSRLRILTQNCLVDAPLPRVVEAIAENRVRRTRSLLRERRSLGEPEWVRAFQAAVRRRPKNSIPSSAEADSLGFSGRLVSIREPQEPWLRLSRSNPPKTTLVHDLGKFLLDPGATSLSEFLRSAAHRPQDLRAIESTLPWVVTQVLREEPNIAEASQAAGMGKYGDLQDWELLEDSWVGHIDWRIMLNDMKGYFENGTKFYPLGSAVGSFRIPHDQPEVVDTLREIFGDYARLRPRVTGIQQSFASWLLILLYVAVHSQRGLVEEIGPSAIQLVTKDARQERYANLGWIESISPNLIHQWRGCLDAAGRLTGETHVALSREKSDSIISLWQQNPESWGLGRLAIKANSQEASLTRRTERLDLQQSNASLSSEAQRTSTLMAAVFGCLNSREDVRSLSDEVLHLLQSPHREFAIEGIRSVHPDKSHLSRVLCLMLAEGISDEYDLRQLLIERLVESFGKDPSNMSEID
ncbi:NACHT domain-containing protein [Streptomyces sp. NPDC002276]